MVLVTSVLDLEKKNQAEFAAFSTTTRCAEIMWISEHEILKALKFVKTYAMFSSLL